MSESSIPIRSAEPIGARGVRVVRFLFVVVRVLPFVVALLFVEQYLAGYSVFTEDSGQMMKVVLDFVDNGEIPLAGQPFFERLRLGPLATYLAAAPLAISRSPRFAYAALALFALLSLPVFYAAARRISTGDLFPALATTVFGVMMNLAVTPYRPVNRAYVPLFYALAMYFFSGAYRGRRLQLFMTWVVLGMCVQLHLATGVLALTLLYHAAARGVRFMAWQSFIGLFVILAMHAPVIVDLTMKPGTAPFEELIALADAEFHLAPSVATYTKIVLAWIAGIAATSGGVAVIYLVRGAMAALGLIRDRWRSFDIGVLSTVHVLLVIFGLSVIKALKDPTDIDAGYVISAVPFVAILVAQSASRDVARLTAHPDQWRNTVLPWFILSIVALTIFSAALAVRWTQVPIMCRHRATMRLDDQLKIADEIQAKTVGLARFHVEQLLFQPDPETGEPRLRSRSYLTYEGLLRWTKRMPPFWERSASSFIGVYLRPRGAATPDYMAAQLIDSRVLSEMQTGCMDVTIFQQPGPIPIIP